MTRPIVDVALPGPRPHVAPRPPRPVVKPGSYQWQLARFADVRARMLSDVAEHELTIRRDDGVDRHMVFRRPPAAGSSWYCRFELITWPGKLLFSGDMGTFVFSRADDMFVWFTAGGFTPDYWSEKLLASSDPPQFCEELFEARVRDEVEEHVTCNDLADWEADALWQELKCDVLIATSTDEAHTLLSEFHSSQGLEFVDSWEWGLTELSHQYLWACHAIRWGIERYREQRPA